jgi:catechol 2,3-dioxygenase-like lactoylglutathione lyase family enzyme
MPDNASTIAKGAKIAKATGHRKRGSLLWINAATQHGKESGVKPFIKVVTLAVDDLERPLRFYRDGMGLETEGVFGTEWEYGAVVFFHLNGGLILALWPKTSLAAEARIPLSEIHSGGMTLGHNVGGKAEVDEVMAQAERAGATIIDPAHDRFFGGYSGYFRDPDGHVWEVIWNKDLEPPETA